MISVGSLCSGYGGLDMGLALGLGTTLRHAWHVENDAAPSKILAERFPGVPNHGDLKTLDFESLERVSVLTAGYPCQPFSDAGLRKGADDPRHLWPYVADAIGHLRPRLVLLENVRGHVRRGLDCVIADLAALGYDASWGLVRASDAGAPHRRERIFIVATDAQDQRHERSGSPRDWWAGPADQRHAIADAASVGRTEGRSEPAWVERGSDAPERGAQAPADADGPGLQGHRSAVRDAAQEPADRGAGAAAPDTDGHRLAGRQERHGRPDRPELEASLGADADGRLLDWGTYEPAIRRWESVVGRRAPWATEPRGRGGAERLSPRFVEWMMGLAPGWVTDVPGLSANEQLKALGNGVVPQQAALAVPVLLHNLAARTEAAA